MSTLYESILSLCTEKGIKGGKMCVDLGFSKSLMTGLKNGTKKGITAETAQKIADYFGVSVGRVLGTEGDKSIEAVHATLSKSEIEAWKTIQDTASRVLGEQKEKPTLLKESELSGVKQEIWELINTMSDEKLEKVLGFLRAAAEV